MVVAWDAFSYLASYGGAGHVGSFGLELWFNGKYAGWVSVQMLKQHYGRMPCSSQVRGLMKAMSLPFKEEKKEFVF